MSRSRRLILLVLGIGACLVLALQTFGLEIWSSRADTLSFHIKSDDQLSHSDEQDKVNASGPHHRGPYSIPVFPRNAAEDSGSNLTNQKLPETHYEAIPGLNAEIANENLSPVQADLPFESGARNEVLEKPDQNNVPEQAVPEKVASDQGPDRPLASQLSGNQIPENPVLVKTPEKQDQDSVIGNQASGVIPDQQASDPPSRKPATEPGPGEHEPNREPSMSEFLKKANEISIRNDLKPPKTMLSPEHLLQIMGSTIGRLPIQNPKKVTYVVVLTYFRSGSSFLGDILQQNWKTFYHFEPLHHLSDGVRLKDSQVPEAMSLLNDLMRCNFSSPVAVNYLQWASEARNTFLMHHNHFLWVACRMQPQLCFTPDFVRFVCTRSPWHVMKLTRLSLQQAGQLVLDNPNLNIKVLNLVRDPRGIISSRRVLTWCNSTSCTDFRVLCKEMNSDYEVFQQLKKAHPDKFFQLRYEDLSMNPEPVTKEVFSSLGLPFTNTVGKFLRLNTKSRPGDVRNPYSTRRDSSRTPFEWRKKFKLEEVKKLQIGCSSVLKHLDYTIVNSSEQLTGDPRKLYSTEKPWLRS